jgi:subtilisin family serine protease
MIVPALFFWGVALAATAPSGGYIDIRQIGLDRSSLAGYPLPLKTSHPAVDSRLLDFRFPAPGLFSNLSATRAMNVPGGDFVRIVIETTATGSFASQAAALSAVRRRAESLGGRVETTFGSLLQAILPTDALESLAAFPFVVRLRRPYVPRPAIVLSEGVAQSGANLWTSLSGYRAEGRRVKIAVLDLGFKGYRGLLGTELPALVTGRSFRADQDVEAGINHGTACAEIIRDMAPDAQLYLVNFSTDVEHHQAVNYLIGEKVDIVCSALGWPNTGPGNGTGPICDDVKKCATAGILWVNAAGDDAERHWEATFADTNADSFHDFATDDEILQWWVPADTWTGAALNWDDWGTWDGAAFGKPTQDYDLLLWRRNGPVWELLQYCDDFQNGLAGQTPVEETSLWKTNVGTYYGVSFLKFNATRNVKLELFVQGASGPIEYAVAAGSLAIPADAAEALAVGATDWSTDTIQSYSSRGPTADGRVKPDLSAPTGVSTVTYGARSFAGTSASAPHVAGALGLLLNKTPFSPAQVRKLLESRALDLGATGKDNLYGYGRLKLGK